MKQWALVSDTASPSPESRLRAEQAKHYAVQAEKALNSARRRRNTAKREAARLERAILKFPDLADVVKEHQEKLNVLRAANEAVAAAETVWRDAELKATKFSKSA